MIAFDKVRASLLVAIPVGMIVAFAIVLVPAEASAPLKVTAIATGSGHTCAVMSSGGVKCWGSNANNELGATTVEHTYTSRPLDVRGLPAGSKGVVVGLNHSCAITSRGGVKCWGSNREGEIGNGGGLGPRTRSGHLPPRAAHRAWASRLIRPESSAGTSSGTSASA